MPDRRPGLSLRTRMVLLGAATVTLILIVGGFLLGFVLRTTLVNNVTQATILRAGDLAALAERGTLPDPIPVAGNDEALAQVIGPDGRVVAASQSIRSDPALQLPRPQPGDVSVHHVASLPIEDDEGGFQVAAVAADTADGPATVYVAASLEDITETLAVIGTLALIALPVLVALLCGAMWVIVGRTLAPVAAITAEADAISGRDPHRRVPEPVRHDEIGRLARTLNRMLSRLEEAIQRQRRFVAAAAHELRSPIASLRAQLETARGSSRPVDWQRASSELLDETIRMQRLAEQLLLLARLDSSGIALRTRAVDLDDVVDTVVARLGDQPVINVDLSDVQPVQVEGDSTLLEQAVNNLITNAIRHANHQVRVRTSHNDHAAALAVGDDGPGIPPDQRDRVLEPFTRLDHARDRDRGGAGLGLAIAHDIAIAHGGILTIGESGLGGAEVELQLPYRKPQR